MADYSEVITHAHELVLEVERYAVWTPVRWELPVHAWCAVVDAYKKDASTPSKEVRTWLEHLAPVHLEAELMGIPVRIVPAGSPLVVLVSRNTTGQEKRFYPK